VETTKKSDQEKPQGAQNEGIAQGGSNKRRIGLQNGSCENSHQGDHPGEHGRVQTEGTTGRVVGCGGGWDRPSGRPGGRRVSTGCLVLESLERLIGGWVYGKDHTGFTVGSLFAIEPQRSSGIDDGEAPLRDHGRVGGNWLIVGIDANCRGCQPSAWVVEARLSDAVILSQELEGDDISLLGGNTLGIVSQSPILSDLDGDVLGPDASSKAQENGNDGKTHVSNR